MHCGGNSECLPCTRPPRRCFLHLASLNLHNLLSRCIISLICGGKLRPVEEPNLNPSLTDCKYCLLLITPLCPKLTHLQTTFPIFAPEAYVPPVIYLFNISMYTDLHSKLKCMSLIMIIFLSQWKKKNQY